jgi:hypothetical protein
MWCTWCAVGRQRTRDTRRDDPSREIARFELWEPWSEDDGLELKLVGETCDLWRNRADEQILSLFGDSERRPEEGRLARLMYRERHDSVRGKKQVR